MTTLTVATLRSGDSRRRSSPVSAMLSSDYMLTMNEVTAAYSTGIWYVALHCMRRDICRPVFQRIDIASGEVMLVHISATPTDFIRPSAFPRLHGRACWKTAVRETKPPCAANACWRINAGAPSVILFTMCWSSLPYYIVRHLTYRFIA